MVGQVATRDFLLDQGLHFAQRLEYTKVEVSAIAEWPHAFGVNRLVRLGAGDGARLDPGVALPVAPVRLQVVVEKCTARRQWPAVTEGPQAHVDTEHAALGGALAQQADHQPSEARKEIFVVDAAATGSRALVGEYEDQIDVRRKIEL